MAYSNQELEELERGYFDILFETLYKNLGTIINQIYSQENITNLPQTQKENQIEKSVEHVAESIISKILGWPIASMAVSSDSCYECGDAIIHIDSKTIGRPDEFNDDWKTGVNRIPVGDNQSSYDSSAQIVWQKRSRTQVTWRPKLPWYISHRKFGEIPNLTYFIRIVYSDTSLVEDMSLISLPNGQFRNEYDRRGININDFPKQDNNVTISNFRFKVNDFKIPLYTTGWEREKFLYIKK